VAYGNPNILPVDASTFEGGTSSWVATGTNATSAVQSTTKLTGTYALRVTATAAGTATVWSSRVAITAGAEYVARVPVGLATSQTGLTATLTIEWWNAASGGSQVGTSAGSATNVSSTVGWQASGYPAAVGVAPAGATHAVVRVAVAGMAASAQYFVDDVYLGVAQNRAGNLVGFNVSSVEVDTSGWQATNATLTRASGVLYTGSGYYCLSATSVAAGVMDIRWVSTVNVITAGTEYVAYAAVQSPSAALSCQVNIDWYDNAFALLGSSTQTFTVDSTIQRIAVVGTAPANATRAKVWIKPTATAASQVFAIDDVSMAVAPNVAGNLLTYNEFSTESALPAWTISNGTGSRAFLTSGITDGFYTFKVAPTAPGMVTATLNRLIPVTAGSTYRVKATAYRHSSQPTAEVDSSMRVRIDWYDSAGVLFQTDNPDQFYPHTETGEWYAQVNSETRTCPTGAAFAKVAWEADSTSALIDGWYFDNIQLVPATPEYTLTSNNDLGLVSLQVLNTYAGAETVTIERVDENGRKSIIRGYGFVYDKAPYTPAPIVVEDYEAPLGSRVWYAITWYTGTDVAARIYTQLVNAPVLTDGDFVWFKSPGIPALNTRVMMEAPPRWSRSARRARYDIVGRKSPIFNTDVRSSGEATISVLVWETDANELFDSLLDSGLPALVQAMPGYGIDGNLYLSVGDVEAEPLDPDARESGWRWTLNVSAIDRPDGGLQGSAGATWQGISDDYATWDDVFNAWESWTDVLTKG
jgi:hypothetical protein